jgi:DNA-binding FadR family transcriptional regulator
MYQVRALIEPVCNAWAAQRILDEDLEAYSASLRHLAPLNIDGTVSSSDAPFMELWLPKGVRDYLQAGKAPSAG